MGATEQSVALDRAGITVFRDTVFLAAGPAVTESPSPDALSRAIKTLTVAVWCLCGLIVLQLGFYGWSYFQSMRWVRCKPLGLRSTVIEQEAS